MPHARRLIATLSVLFALFAVGSAASADDREAAIQQAIEDGNKRYAILVGVGDYSQAPPVEFVRENLDEMEDLMRKVFFVPAANIRRMDNPDLLELGATFGFRKGNLGDFAGLGITHEDAELFVYFVGHGSRDLRSAGTSDAAKAEGFLLASNSRPALLRDTAYSYDTLVANLDRFQKETFPEGRVVLFMESCFSGQTGGGEPLNPSMSVDLLAPEIGWDEEADKLDVIAISAAAADTPAYWDDQRQRGLFTGALADGLRGRADATSGNNDGTVSFDELRSWLETSVPNRAARLGKGRQVPQVSDGAEGAVVRLASAGPADITFADPAALALEFELEELTFRAEEIGERDWKALSELRSDIDDFMERCGGDGCRTFLPKIIPLRDVADVAIANCSAASQAAGRWIDEGSFRSVARLSRLCVDKEEVDACVESRDAASRACLCVKDPFSEGCDVDPEAVCNATLEAALSEAQSSMSLVPLDAFEAEATTDCVATHRQRVATAREDVCEAGRLDRGPVPDGLAQCPWAEEVRIAMARSSVCEREWTAARYGTASELARFLTENTDCAQHSEAQAERDSRITAAIAGADTATDARARRRATDELANQLEAFRPTLSNAALRRLEDLMTTLGEQPCAVAFREAERGGEAALSRFVAERADCPAEVSQARTAMTQDRCEEIYNAVDESDAAALYRFTLASAQCTSQVARANRLIDKLGSDCIYEAQTQGLRADLDAVDGALRALSQCNQIAVLSDRLGAQYNDAETALRDMRQTIALRQLQTQREEAQRREEERLAAERRRDEQRRAEERRNTRPTQPTYTPPASSGPQLAVYENTDFYGADLTRKGVDAYSTSACAQICQRNSRCTSFTFNTRANRCFPKTGYGRVVRFNGAQSGVILRGGQSAPTLRADGAPIYAAYVSDLR